MAVQRRVLGTEVCGSTGTRSVSMVFRAVVFTFVPTALELVLVCGLLARSFAPQVAAMVLATFGAYVAWTTALTSAGLKVRFFFFFLFFLTSVRSCGS